MSIVNCIKNGSFLGSCYRIMSKHASPHECLVRVLGEERWRDSREENIPEESSKWITNHAMITCLHSQRTSYKCVQ